MKKNMIKRIISVLLCVLMLAALSIATMAEQDVMEEHALEIDIPELFPTLTLEEIVALIEEYSLMTKYKPSYTYVDGDAVSGWPFSFNEVRRLTWDIGPQRIYVARVRVMASGFIDGRTVNVLWHDVVLVEQLQGISNFTITSTSVVGNGTASPSVSSFASFRAGYLNVPNANWRTSLVTPGALRVDDNHIDVFLYCPK